MAETLGQVLNYINEILPNRMNSTTIVTLINNETRKIWKHMTSTQLYNFDTITDQAYYNLPSDCDFESIVENGVMISNTTNSTSYTVYTYCGADEELTGNRYFEGLTNTFGLYPIPDNSYSARIKYQERPLQIASSDTATQFNLDQDYIDVIKFRVMSRVAKSGNNPDVDLGNNFELDAIELEKKLKVKRANERMKNPRYRHSYRLDWK